MLMIDSLPWSDKRLNVTKLVINGKENNVIKLPITNVTDETV